MWGFSKSDIISSATYQLGLVVADICQSHGVEHATQVLEHTKEALKVHTPPMNEDREILIMLASLLHDADDHKFFTPQPPGESNAENILKKCSNNLINEEQSSFIMYMIDLVSCSKNHNEIPDEAIKHPEILYPRYSDRLEALGEIGAQRCLQYTGNGPKFVDSTPRPKSSKELDALIDPIRFKNYKGNSASMLDHYYDKLLHLGNFSSGNSYLDSEACKRSQIMKDICIYYGIHGELHPSLY